MKKFFMVDYVSRNEYVRKALTRRKVVRLKKILTEFISNKSIGHHVRKHTKSGKDDAKRNTSIISREWKQRDKNK